MTDQSECRKCECQERLARATKLIEDGNVILAKLIECEEALQHIKDIANRAIPEGE